MNESPVFVVGCPRSGTMLLRDLLRAHPRLTLPPESHFIPSFYRGYGDPRSEREAVELARRILNLEWIRLWDVSVDAAAFARDRSFQRVVCRLYEAWARQEGKPRWGDKTPHYVTDIDALLDIFPSAKIIHIIRDGRDVALSWLNSRLEPRNLYTAATLWKQYVTGGRIAGAALADTTYLEVRYESLLGQPAETMRAVCAFIGEPFTEAMLEPNSLPTISREGIFSKREEVLAQPPATIDKTNVEKWRTAMSSSDREIFESVAGDLLAALGYETEGRARRIDKPEELFWKAHHKFWWTAARLNTQGNHRWLKTEFEMRRAQRRSRGR